MSPDELGERPTVVFDASAVLAFLQAERGGDVVASNLARGVITTVNLAEVLQKCVAHAISTDGLADDLEALGLHALPFTRSLAEISADIWPVTRHAGLSLADRACLAAAIAEHLPVYTADQDWRKVAKSLGIDVRVIR